MTFQSIPGEETFNTFAESKILLSVFKTPLIVPANTGQKDAKKITNTDTLLKLGNNAIP